MKTGFGLFDTDTEQTEEVLLFVISALRVFSKDGMVTAARYTIGKGRKEVTGDDMKRGLMYQARKFFEQPDETLYRRIQREIEKMKNESSEEEGEEGEEEEEEEGGEEGEEEEEEGEEGEEEEEGEEGEEGEEEEGSEDEDNEKVDDMSQEQCERLSGHVDIIHDAWHLWNPTDPVHCMIKRAIDNCPSEETSE